MTVGQLFNRSVWAIALFCGFSLQAQHTDRCGTDVMQQHYIDQNPALELQLQQLRTDLLQNMAPQANKGAVQITIPVVVHVIHEGEAVGVGTNLSNAQVLSQIEVLNEDYQKLNADTSNTPSAYKPFAANLEIEFKLAVRDPDGNLTSGITRTQGSQNGYTMSQFDASVKPNTVWDRDQYLNIWTVRLTGASSGTLGYAIKPGNSADIDGVTIGFRFFGRTGNLQSPFDQGRTCTHEVGHWLGLDHLWGVGDPAVTNCIADDGIADTPEQGKANYGCPNFPRISCSNGPNGDMFMNYMDYVNDNCMSMFTEGQKTLMYAVLNGPRAGIKSSTAATLYQYDVSIVEVLQPSDTVCNVEVLPLIAVRNEGTETITQLFLNYNLDNTSLNQVVWTGSMEPGEVLNIPMNTLNLTTGDHNLDIYLSSPNGQLDENTGNDQVNIDFYVNNNFAAGFPLPYVQNFDGSPTFPPNGWSTNNVDGDTAKWAANYSVSSFGGNGSCVWVNLFDLNTTATVDELVMLAMETDPNFHPAMSFDVAYAKTDVGSSDQLNVYYSLNCGIDWVLAWSKSGDALSTTTDRVGAFVPAADDWSTEYVITPWVAGQSSITYKFEVIAGGGNNLYLDNININAWNVGVEELETEIDLSLYPNPADNSFNLSSTDTDVRWNSLELYDLSGAKVLSRQLYNSQLNETVDVSALSSGLYIVRLNSDKGSVHRKLMVK